MARKDVTDRQVLEAYRDAIAGGHERWPHELLAERTGEPKKVCVRACERAFDRGLIEYGVSLRSGWIEPAGEALLADESQE